MEENHRCDTERLQRSSKRTEPAAGSASYALSFSIPYFVSISRSRPFTHTTRFRNGQKERERKSQPETKRVSPMWSGSVAGAMQSGAISSVDDEMLLFINHTTH